MKRPAFTGDHDVADAQRSVLRNVFDDNAAQIAASYPPPTSPLHDRRNAARIIGGQQHGTGKRGSGNDASDDAGRSHDAGVTVHARAITFVDRHRTGFVFRRKTDDARLDAVIEVDEGPYVR